MSLKEELAKKINLILCKPDGEHWEWEELNEVAQNTCLKYAEECLIPTFEAHIKDFRDKYWKDVYEGNKDNDIVVYTKFLVMTLRQEGDSAT